MMASTFGPMLPLIEEPLGIGQGKTNPTTVDWVH